MPGEYSLNVKVFKRDQEVDLRTLPFAMGETTVTVPVGAAPNAPLNIGEVRLIRQGN